MLIKIESMPMEKVYKNKDLLKRVKILNLVGSKESTDSYFYDCISNKAPGTIIFARNKSDRIIGWGFIMKHDYQPDTLKVQFFIQKRYRRKGVGTLILGRAKLIAKRRKKELVCCPWDHVSRRFFEKDNYVQPMGYYYFTSDEFVTKCLEKRK